MKLANALREFEPLFRFLADERQFKHIKSVNQGLFWSETILGSETMLVLILIEKGWYWVGCTSTEVDYEEEDSWLGVIEIREFLTGESAPESMTNNFVEQAQYLRNQYAEISEALSPSKYSDTRQAIRLARKRKSS